MIASSLGGAQLTSLLRCEAVGFKDPRPGHAEIKLLRYVEDYFTCGDFNPEHKVRCTSMPPLYFQHRGHSLTIIGLEKRATGDTDLLVFDPVFRDSDRLTKLTGPECRDVQIKSPDSVLKLYRRGNKYLRKYHEFELLRYVFDYPLLLVHSLVPSTNLGYRLAAYGSVRQ
jgi:zinc finger-containing ubiquitin peptidase 1